MSRDRFPDSQMTGQLDGQARPAGRQCKITAMRIVRQIGIRIGIKLRSGLCHNSFVGAHIHYGVKAYWLHTPIMFRF